MYTILLDGYGNFQRSKKGYLNNIVKMTQTQVFMSKVTNFNELLSNNIKYCEITANLFFDKY